VRSSGAVRSTISACASAPRQERVDAIAGSVPTWHGDLRLDAAPGNLLVLQNDNAASSLVQTVPGIFDRPKHDADGGILTFTFPSRVQPSRLDLVDIDPG